MRGAALGGTLGVARVLRLELPQAHVLCADIDRKAAGGALHAAPTGELELVWSAGVAHAARLQRGIALSSDAAGGRASRLKVGGSWMVTGGLGGLGLQGAALLAKVGATRLVLASRSGRVARDGQGLAETLRRLGTASASRVTVVACDEP